MRYQDRMQGEPIHEGIHAGLGHFGVGQVERSQRAVHEVAQRRVDALGEGMKGRIDPGPVLRWADACFAHHFAGGPAPERAAAAGNARAEHERRGWWRH